MSKNRNYGKKQAARKNPPRKTKSARERDISVEEKAERGTNDPSWYMTDPALARDAASIVFSRATGTTSNLNLKLPLRGMEWSGPATNRKLNFAAPGLLIEWLSPSLGYTLDETSPINVAAASIYTFIRHANSGHANYDASDLGIYLLAIGEIISYINFLTRAYGSVSLVSGQNRYLPNVLLEAQHINYRDLTQNIAQFRYGINLAMVKLSSFAVPSNFTYYARKLFLYSHIYTEGTSAKDQMYLYAPAGFLEVSYDNDGATALKYVRYHNAHSGASDRSTLTVSHLLERLNRMIDQLFYSEDFNIMSGDILKAYGEGGILKFAPIPDTLTVGVEPVDIGVLEQMKNATVYPWAQPQEDRIVVTETLDKDGMYKGPLKSDLNEMSVALSQFSSEMAAGLYLADRNHILTTTTADVGPELVLESTRLMTGVEIDIGGPAYIVKLYSGSEICVDAWVVQFNFDTENEADWKATSVNNVRISLIHDDDDRYDMIEYSIAIDAARLWGVLSAFKFAPQSWLAWVLETGDHSVDGFRFQLVDMMPCVSFDNYAVMDQAELRRIHEAVMMNMLKVPSIGSAYSV